MKFKDVEFDSLKIVLHKKNKNLIINKNVIEDIAYIKPTLFNYLLCGVVPGSSTFPGRLEIKTKVKIGKSKLHLIRISYEEVLTLPYWCLQIIDPSNTGL